MIKNVIFQHKAEKERLVTGRYIHRENLLKFNKFLTSGLIKVITGIRRSGKSVFSMLLLKREKFAYLNFDDEELLKLKNYDEIVKSIFEVYSDAKFILFDEIQNLDKWELFVNKLQRRGFSLILTGSNANLLGKELATKLTGRYVVIEIYPFSFREFLTANNFNFEKKEIFLPEDKGKILNYIEKYIRVGGFPEVIVKGLEVEVYLDTLFDAILFKDVVKRYRVRYPQKIYDLAIYLVSNFTHLFSFTKLKNMLNFRSTNTVEKYLKYLEESYLIFTLNRFSFKLKEQIKSPRKIYIVDNGFIEAKSFRFSKDLGKRMENVVFIEILRRGYKQNQDVFYYKTRNGYEVDFVLRESIRIKKLIQTCYDVEDYSTKKREVKGLMEASNELKCKDLLIITWDYEAKEKYGNRTIKFLPLWKWLLSWKYK